MAVFFALASLVEALDYRDSIAQVCESLLVGLIVGMPATMYCKRSMRKQMDMHVLAALRPMPADIKRPYRRESVRMGILVFVSLSTIVLVSEVLRIPNRSGFFMPFILLVLTYPEQKTIWKSAKARLAEMEGRD